jgi:hypothetical protein
MVAPNRTPTPLHAAAKTFQSCRLPPCRSFLHVPLFPWLGHAQHPPPPCPIVFSCPSTAGKEPPPDQNHAKTPPPLHSSVGRPPMHHSADLYCGSQPPTSPQAAGPPLRHLRPPLTIHRRPPPPRILSLGERHRRSSSWSISPCPIPLSSSTISRTCHRPPPSTEVRRRLKVPSRRTASTPFMPCRRSISFATSSPCLASCP